jgi:ubiquinol-cytochrome c reductase iron-sulfur subunit
MARVGKWALAAAVWLVVRLLRRQAPPTEPPEQDEEPPGRIVAEGEPDHGGERLVLALIAATVVSAAAFPVVYALDGLPHHTQLLGLCIGLALLLGGAALIVAGKRLVVDEEIEESYPQPEHEADAQAVGQMVEEAGDKVSRKRLLTLGAAAAGGALGVAFLTPAASLGPVFDTNTFLRTPWRRGRRLVDEGGDPIRAADVDRRTFYTAFPEGAPREQNAAPIVVVRLRPQDLRLPRHLRGYDADGILAFSKICTHAGCAISLYRTPLFPAAAPRPALVCPCHYSTFDVAEGAKVIFGPAGRPLPMLPLMIDGEGMLRAAGNFDAPVGPAWWGVRMNEPTT